MDKANESLFLLEALIDKVTFFKHPCMTDRDFLTCVNISFSSVDALEICDDDVSTDLPKDNPFVKYFNIGKSCLFPLKDSEISEAMNKCLVKAVIEKILPTGCLPTRIIMGESVIDMTKEFVQANKMQLEDSNKISYQALKDSFRITAADGSQVGEILMFLRISCFGNNIVTQFQGGQAPSVLMTGENATVDRSCEPRKEFQTMENPCSCGTPNISGPKRKNRPLGEDVSYTDIDDPCYCSGPKPKPKDELACRNTDQYCLHVPKGQSNEYEEIGTPLNGNALKIKVPKNASIIKKISQTHCSLQRPYTKSKRGEGKCQPPCGKNQINLALPCEAICCQGPQLQNTQFTCTTDGCTMPTKHGQTGAQPTREFEENLKEESSEAGDIHQPIDLSKKIADAMSECIMVSTVSKNNHFDKVLQRKSTVPIKSHSLFSNDILVNMALYNTHNQQYTESFSQATGSINKCLQVKCDDIKVQYFDENFIDAKSSDYTTSTITPSAHNGHYINARYNCPEVYFFGSKKQPSSKPNVQSVGSQSKVKKCGGSCAGSAKTIVGNASAQARSNTNTSSKSNMQPVGTQSKLKQCFGRCAKKTKTILGNTSDQSISPNNAGVQTKNPTCAGTGPCKSVSIKDGRCPRDKPCPYKERQMAATIPHIKLGYKEPRVEHLSHLCKGPKYSEDRALVTVSSINNPRRVVFELVIRRLNGASLAKNELMLEWTPPPTKPAPCGVPCILPIPNKSICKMVLCKPKYKTKVPCQLRSCFLPCKKPCTRSKLKVCYSRPCDTCQRCFDPCGIPSKLCPVGHPKSKRSRSPKKIKAHCRYISPCRNRSRTCPSVKYRSSLGADCVSSCPPKRSCSVIPLSPLLSCTKSRCSSCCSRPC